MKVPHLFSAADQAELFDFDPWGGSHCIARAVKPCAGIARAIVAPLFVARDPSHQLIFAMVVSTDGLRVAIDSCPQHAFVDGSAWTRLRAKLRVNPYAIEGAVAGVEKSMLDDCVINWFKPSVFGFPQTESVPWPLPLRSWYRLVWQGPTAENGLSEAQCEAEALQALQQELRNAVTWVLAALEPRLHRLLYERPKLGIHMARHLLQMAAEHGSDAERFVWQALSTEPLGLLACAARDDSRTGAQDVRTCIFEGRRLPKVLGAMGITWSAHRLALRHTGKAALDHPLSELLRTEAAYFAAQRLLAMLPRHLWPTTAEERLQFVELTDFILGFSEPPAGTFTLLKWVLAWAKNEGVVERLKYLLKAVKDIVRSPLWPTANYADEAAVAAELTRCLGTLTPKQKLEQPDLPLLAQNPVSHAHVIAILTGFSLGELVAPLFQRARLLSARFEIDKVQYRCLTSLDEILALGSTLENCLEQVNGAMNYVVQGCLVFEVSTCQCVVSAVAIGVHDSGDPHAGISCAVHEVGGKQNSYHPLDKRRARRLAQMVRRELQGRAGATTPGSPPIASTPKGG